MKKLFVFLTLLAIASVLIEGTPKTVTTANVPEDGQTENKKQKLAKYAIPACKESFTN